MRVIAKLCLFIPFIFSTTIDRESTTPYISMFVDRLIRNAFIEGNKTIIITEGAATAMSKQIILPLFDYSGFLLIS